MIFRLVHAMSGQGKLAEVRCRMIEWQILGISNSLAKVDVSHMNLERQERA